MAEKGCLWGDTAPDKEDRPWEKRGFTVTELADTYPSLSRSDLRNKEWRIEKDGSSPAQAASERQKKSKDAGN